MVVQHHLKTPPGHGPPKDVLVIAVGEVIAAQLTTELSELFAQRHMMQNIRRQVERIVGVGGVAHPRHLKGIAQIPGLPPHVGKEVAMMTGDVNQLLTQIAI